MTIHSKLQISSIILLFLSLNANASLVGSTQGGIFISPDPACVGPVVCDGVDTDTISWGALDDPANFQSTLTFTPASFTTELNEPFTVGHLEFTNGQNVIGSWITGITLKVTLGDVNDDADSTDDSTNDVIYDNSVRDYVFIIDTTDNTPGDPFDDASIDTVSYDIARSEVFLKPDGTTNVFFDVKENGTTRVELLGQLSSFLAAGFGEVDDPSVGRVRPLVIPEPSTFLLFVAGILLLAAKTHNNRDSSLLS